MSKGRGGKGQGGSKISGQTVGLDVDDDLCGEITSTKLGGREEREGKRKV